MAPGSEAFDGLVGRGEGHEEWRAVANPIGVGLVAHGLAHLVGSGDVPAARLRVVQDLAPARQVAVGSLVVSLRRLR